MMTHASATQKILQEPVDLFSILPAFEQEIHKTLEQGIAPGLAVGIVSRDSVHYLKGFGVKKLGNPDPIQPSSLFQLASLSKPVSATLLALCQQKGLSSYTDQASQHLPDLFQGDCHQLIRIQNMLNHTIGMSYEEFEDMIESYTPLKDILERFKTATVMELGKQYEYNNVSYGLVGDIISAALKEPFESALSTYLFNPLGMKRASVGFSSLLQDNDRAYPHMVNKEGKFKTAPHYSHAYYALPSAAGINASVQDMASFIQLYLGKYPQLLTHKELEVLYTPTIRVPDPSNSFEDPDGLIQDVDYGLGWLVTKLHSERLVYHSGWLNGFRNFMGFLPDRDIGIVILSNTDNKKVYQLAIKFFDLYLRK